MKNLVFEAPDGAGKSVAVEFASKYIKDKYNLPVAVAQHPGTTPLGLELRKLIKNRHDLHIDPYTIQVLMAADFCSFIDQILNPALKDDTVVISDRFNLISGLVYGVASGLNIEDMKMIFNIPLSKYKCKCELIILMAPYDIIKNRQHHDIVEINGKKVVQECRFEKLGEDFHKRVINNYNNLICRDNYSTRTFLDGFVRRQHVIDVSCNISEVHRQVARIIDEAVHAKD